MVRESGDWFLLNAGLRRRAWDLGGDGGFGGCNDVDLAFMKR